MIGYRRNASGGYQPAPLPEGSPPPKPPRGGSAVTPPPSAGRDPHYRLGLMRGAVLVLLDAIENAQTLDDVRQVAAVAQKLVEEERDGQ